MLELQLEIQLEGQINLEMEIQNTEIVVVDGFDYFDIDWINPTLSAGTLTADFAFSPSPQEDVTKIELWINGSLVETRMSNDESAFVVNGIVGGAEVQIKAYNDSLLMQQSDVFQLPIPNAPDFIDFSFGSSKTIDIIAESSDPQNLPITIKYLGIPTNGLVSLLDSDTISVQEIDRNNPTLIPYVIENTAGVTDNGLITFHWESIDLTITSPTEAQEIPNNEDITVSFTVTPAQQDYISSIALVIDGVEVEKRTPYSTDDFTIAAGTLDVDTHTIVVRAYDANDEVVYNSQAVSVDVVASATRLLDIYPNQYGESWALIQRNSNFTGDLIEVRRSDNQVQRFGLDSGIIPIAAISSFVGSGDGRITWYKGQANGLVVQQPNAANQPLLFENGILITENGLPTLKFEGNQWLNGGDIMNANFRPLISVAVAINTGISQCVYAKSIFSGNNNRYALQSHNQVCGSTLDYSWYNRFAIRNQVMNNGVHKAIDNNQFQSSKNEINELDSNYDFLIGAYNSSTGLGASINFYIGNISEVHIWFEDIESNLSNINGIINNDYGIY